ncbi:helix-turn-helix domain-containing protein [Flavobacterium chungangensis]|uniref:Helix-turn-helix domain-containing protein n=1 Tax=Flavobacterium chungangensis TaxID=2708132 RepID=A0ABV8ZLL6_9FLAO
MKAKNKNLVSLEDFVEQHYGKTGTPKRDELEAGYEIFKIGVLLQEARLQKGMTQEELAVKAGTTRSYISKIENNIKEVKFSTLQKIVELGLGGHLELSIKL